MCISYRADDKGNLYTYFAGFKGLNDKDGAFYNDTHTKKIIITSKRKTLKLTIIAEERGKPVPLEELLNLEEINNFMITGKL
mgnify:CR=1 FL=1